MKQEPLSKTLSFSCSKETYEKVQAMAAEDYRTPAWILRKIVERYFDGLEKAKKGK